MSCSFKQQLQHLLVGMHSAPRFPGGGLRAERFALAAHRVIGGHGLSIGTQNARFLLSESVTFGTAAHAAWHLGSGGPAVWLLVVFFAGGLHSLVFILFFNVILVVAEERSEPQLGERLDEPASSDRFLSFGSHNAMVVDFSKLRAFVQIDKVEVAHLSLVVVVVGLVADKVTTQTLIRTNCLLLPRSALVSLLPVTELNTTELNISLLLVVVRWLDEMVDFFFGDLVASFRSSSHLTLSQLLLTLFQDRATC